MNARPNHLNVFIVEECATGAGKPARSWTKIGADPALPNAPSIRPYENQTLRNSLIVIRPRSITPVGDGAAITLDGVDWAMGAGLPV